MEWTVHSADIVELDPSIWKYIFIMVLVIVFVCMYFLIENVTRKNRSANTDPPVNCKVIFPMI